MLSQDDNWAISRDKIRNKKIKSLKNILLECTVINFVKLFYSPNIGNGSQRTDIVLPPKVFRDILSKSLEIRWMIPTPLLKTCLDIGARFQMDMKAMEDYIYNKQVVEGERMEIYGKNGSDWIMKRLKIKAEELETYDFSPVASNLEMLAAHFRQPLFYIEDDFPRLSRLEITYPKPIEFPISLESCRDSLKVLDVTVRIGHQFMEKIRTLENLTALSLTHSVVDDISFKDISDTALSLKNLRKLDIGFLLRNNLDSISISYADLVSMVTKSKTLKHLDVSGSNLQSFTSFGPPEMKLEFFGLVYCHLNKTDALTAYKLAKRVASLSNVDSLLTAGEAYSRRRFLFDVILNNLKTQYPFNAVYVSHGWMERLENIILDGIDIYLEDVYMLEKLKDILIQILHSKMFTSDFLAKATNVICSSCETIETQKIKDAETIVYDLGLEIITNRALAEYVNKVFVNNPSGILARKLSDHISRFKII